MAGHNSVYGELARQDEDDSPQGDDACCGDTDCPCDGDSPRQAACSALALSYRQEWLIECHYLDGNGRLQRLVLSGSESASSALQHQEDTRAALEAHFRAGGCQVLSAQLTILSPDRLDLPSGVAESPGQAAPSGSCQVIAFPARRTNPKG